MKPRKHNYPAKRASHKLENKYLESIANEAARNILRELEIPSHLNHEIVRLEIQCIARRYFFFRKYGEKIK